MLTQQRASTASSVTLLLVEKGHQGTLLMWQRLMLQCWTDLPYIEHTHSEQQGQLVSCLDQEGTGTVSDELWLLWLAKTLLVETSHQSLLAMWMRSSSSSFGQGEFPFTPRVRITFVIFPTVLSVLYITLYVDVCWSLAPDGGISLVRLPSRHRRGLCRGAETTARGRLPVWVHAPRP